MSLGYIGYCKQLEKTSDKLIYGYTCENWNHPENSKLDPDYLQGMFEFNIKILRAPYIIHTEKVINKTKKIKEFRELGIMPIDRQLKIVKSHYLDTVNNGIAKALFYELIFDYIKTGEVPEKASIFK